MPQNNVTNPRNNDNLQLTWLTVNVSGRFSMFRKGPKTESLLLRAYSPNTSTLLLSSCS